jgi:hypothetical protein
MDEQGVYCSRWRSYVHFWSLPRPADIPKPVPGQVVEMPKSCQLCGHKGSYQASDLRTRRVPTEPVRAAMLAPETRRASTIDVQDALETLGVKKRSGPNEP